MFTGSQAMPICSLHMEYMNEIKSHFNTQLKEESCNVNGFYGSGLLDYRIMII